MAWASIAVAVSLYVVVSRATGRREIALIPGLGLAESAAFVVGGIAVALLAVTRIVRFLADRLATPSLVYLGVKQVWNLSENGDVSGTLIYQVRNRTREDVHHLPLEGLIWFRRPERDEVHFRLVLRDGEHSGRLESSSYSFDEQKENQVNLKFSKEHLLSWNPRIHPPIKPGEVVTYEVQIRTPGTEIDAFSPTGSTIGFPVNYPTNRIEFMAQAPLGWRFEFTPPRWTVRSLDGKIEIEPPGNMDHPAFIEGDGSFLRWDLDAPRLGARYIASYRLVKK